MTVSTGDEESTLLGVSEGAIPEQELKEEATLNVGGSIPYAGSQSRRENRVCYSLVLSVCLSLFFPFQAAVR